MNQANAPLRSLEIHVNPYSTLLQYKRTVVSPLVWATRGLEFRKETLEAFKTCGYASQNSRLQPGSSLVRSTCKERNGFDSGCTR
jgi:hypothetical protein